MNSNDSTKSELIMSKIRNDADRILSIIKPNHDFLHSNIALDGLINIDFSELCLLNSLELKDVYDYHEFLNYDGPTFVYYLYKYLLRREPDSSEIQSRLESLYEIGISKEVLIFDISNSAECISKNIKVIGLSRVLVLLHKFSRFPFLGYPLKIILSLHESASQKINISKRLSELDKIRLMQIKMQQELSRTLDCCNKLEDLTLKISVLTSNYHEQGRRLNLLLEEVRKRLPEPISQEQILNMQNILQEIQDAMYVSFEDIFRGTRQEIKKRQEVYLPYLSASLAGTQEFPIFDIGCGRGEWLELCKENSLFANGVDLNLKMIEHCHSLGLNAVQSDALTLLRELPANSLGAITSFHLVEHLSLDIMCSLFKECLRVLKPGGIVIFETPNPENIIVGSCNFYIDPTHSRPLPPVTLRFLIEQNGFIDAEILRLHPVNQFNVNVDSDTFSHEIASRFNCEQDYSVIARKA